LSELGQYQRPLKRNAHLKKRTLSRRWLDASSEFENWQTLYGFVELNLTNPGKKGINLHFGVMSRGENIALREPLSLWTCILGFRTLGGYIYVQLATVDGYLLCGQFKGRTSAEEDQEITGRGGRMGGFLDLGEGFPSLVRKGNL